MTTADTFTHFFKGKKKFNKIYIDEPQYIIEHFNFRKEAFLPILEELLEDNEIQVIGLTGTARYLDSLGFNPVYFRPQQDLIKRPINFIEAKFGIERITNTIIKEEKEHKGFRAYRIDDKDLIRQSVELSWQLGQPAVAVFSNNSKDKDYTLDAINKPYYVIHGLNAKEGLEELRSGKFRDSVSVFHTGIFDSGVDFQVSDSLRDNCIQRIIFRSSGKKGGGRRYYAPLLNVASQYFARFRDKTGTTPEEKASLYPTLELYGCFQDSKKMSDPVEVKNTASTIKDPSERVEYIYKEMSKENAYSLEDWSKEIENNNYKVSFTREMTKASSSNNTASNKHLFKHLYLTECFSDMRISLEEKGIELMEYINVDLAMSGEYELTISQKSKAEELCAKIWTAIEKGIKQEWYWVDYLSTIALDNSIKFLELHKESRTLDRILYKGEMTREEWNSFSKENKKIISQSLKRYFSVNGDFFKGSKESRYPVLYIKPIEELEVTLPDAIENIYSIWNHRKTMENQTENNQLNTNQLLLTLN